MTIPNYDGVPNNNPAARLHAALVAFRNQGLSSGGSTLAVVWAKVFAFPPTDVDAIFSLVADLRATARQVRALVEPHGDMPAGLFLKHFARIEKLLNATNLDADWRGFDASVDQLALEALEFTAYGLSRSHPEATIDDEELAAARAELEDAYQAVRETSIDATAKQALLSILDAMQDALRRYRTIGIDAFWQALSGALADILAMRPADQVETTEASDAPSWKSKVTAVLVRLDVYAARAKSGHSLFTSLRAIARDSGLLKLLPGSSEGGTAI